MTSRLALAAGRLVLAVLLAACGTGVEQTAPPSSSDSPGLTPVPGGVASPALGSSVGPPTTSQSDIGLIWDALPPSFPVPAGAIPTDAQGPASGSFALGMPVLKAQGQLENSLTAAGWSVDVGSPLEDGTVVIEATGPADGCRTEVRLTPLSGTVSMSVLYGASCPFT